MASYSVALQLRAAQEVIKRAMPLRSLATRVLLMCDVASALLLIQLGQFTHPAFSIFPIVATAAVALQRRNYADDRTVSRALDPRGILGSILTPMQYSNFGFFPRQIGARRVICPMILIRLLCGGALLFIVQLGDCSLTSVFFCRCYRRLEFGPEKVRWEGWYKPGGYGRTWSCDGSPELWLYNKEAVDKEHPLQLSGQRVLAQGRARDVCNGTDLVEPSFGQHWTSGTQQPTNLELNLNSSRWCAPESSMPAMLSPSCQRHEIDLVGVQVCLKSVPGVFETMCSGIFLLCAIWVGRNPVIFTYLFVPTAALLVLVLMHCVAQLCSASLADVEENKPFRKEIRRQAKKHHEQLQTGNLDHSLWLGRATLAFQLSFFLLDIASDGVCFVEFVQNGLWGSAACQGTIFIVSSILQFRNTGCKKLARLSLESWSMGLPCNELQRLLVEEKTFEAPLSLFIQYFSAFWLTENDEAFLTLWFSMFLSTFGISSGFFLSNHIAIIDFEDLNDDAADTTATPSSQQIGQAIVPPRPPSQRGQAKLPPPPGLVFPERYFQPCPPNGRQGQQGLATE